jgi:hypothetical protein
VADNKEEPPYSNNLFSNHFLQERLEDLEDWKHTEIEEKFEELQELWEEKKDYLQNNPNEDNTQKDWIDEILKIIGHKTWNSEPTKTIGNNRNLNPDYIFFKDSETKKRASNSDNEFEKGYVIGEAKKWGRELDKSTDDHSNPSFQIYNYVDRLRVPWGVLTNGKKWRLYSYEDCEADVYYEIDLIEEIIDEEKEEKALQNFKFFYLFFRKEAFLPESEGFIDKVLEGSINYSKELEEDLEDKIYTALEITARGFFETNDIEKSEENVEKVHRASLILLYRILFILNAESRKLLPVDNDRYYDRFSLQRLNEKMIEEEEQIFSKDTMLWETIVTNLFEAIDNGKNYENLKITAYNGGLFSQEENPFLSELKLQGNHIEQVLRLLAQSKDEETGRKVLVDYRDLNIRHLGSVYEGLLEHQLEVAENNLIVEGREWKNVEEAEKDFGEAPKGKKVEEGQIYLTNESGERKSTGSYYTPEYVVEHIVENIVGPKVQEKIKEAEDDSEILDKVLEVDVCDPAMGSGHFLTEATSYIAHRIVEHAEIDEDKIDEGNELVWVKRQVVRRCIYGVDINPLATELAKLSLWIETMSKGKPLSFLDHHLKVGNSLLGSDLDEIETHPDSSDDEQQEMFTEVNMSEIKADLRHQYQEIDEMPEEELSQIKAKEKAYEELVNSNFTYTNLVELFNIHTYQHFNRNISAQKYDSITREITEVKWKDFRQKEWFQRAQLDSESQNYFHWEIEFPQVFFGENNGFDIIVGNPPWIDIKGLENPDILFKMYDTSFNRVNIYSAFIEKSTELLRNGGNFGFITPNSFMTQSSYKPLREHIIDNYQIREFVRVPDTVFPDVTMECVIEIFKKGYTDRNYDIEALIYDREQKVTEIGQGNPEERKIKIDQWRSSEELIFDIFTSKQEREVLNKIGETKFDIENKFETCLGITPYDKYEGHSEDQIDNRVFHANEKKTENHYKVTTGEGITRYNLEWKGGEWIKYGDWLGAEREKKFFTEPRCVVRQIVSGGSESIKAAYCEDEIFHTQVGFVFLPKDRRKSSAKSLTGILNSKLMSFYHTKKFLDENKDTFQKILIQDAKKFPLPEKYNSDDLVSKIDSIRDLKEKRSNIDLELIEYLGAYGEGKTLNDLYTPVSGASDTPLFETSEDKEKLQIGSVETEKDGDSITLLVSARYKPENEAAYETNQYGYTETELYPAMEFHDLSKTEAALIEEFVPVAVDEAGGFADFRESTTKTMSLIDRLKKLILPKVSDVEDDLQKFIEQKEKAEGLEEKIEKTDQEINEIVYDLYDLTEEEIEIVEESVNG